MTITRTTEGIYTITNGPATIGWVHRASRGCWRALTRSGHLTHHRTLTEAVETIEAVEAQP